MSPGRTFRRHGLSTGSEKSSTTYASFAVDRSTLVVTSCGQRRGGAAVGLASKARSSRRCPSDIATQSCIDWACGGATFTRPAGSPGAPLAAIESSAGATPVPRQSDIDRAPGCEPEHQPQWLRCGPDVDVAHDRRTAAPLDDGHPLAHVRTANGVLEHDALTDEAHGLESAERVGQRSAADLCDGWCRLARIVERRTRTNLPSRVDAVRRPALCRRARARGLAALRLAIGLAIRPGGQRAAASRPCHARPRRRAADRYRTRPSSRGRGSG